MPLTSNYSLLAAIAPKKKKTHRPKRQRAKYPFHGPTPKIPMLACPPGTLRYFLSVPSGRTATAVAVGCQYDPSSQRWYIDNPTNLEDLAAWKPTRVGFDKLKKQAIKLHSARADTQPS